MFFIRDPLKFQDFIHTQKRDLYNNIESGNYPKWCFCIQVMTEQRAALNAMG